MWDLRPQVYSSSSLPREGSVPKLAIIRQIYFLPGREEDGTRWLGETEGLRRAAGQSAQWVLRGQIDTREYLWVQIWETYHAYEGWRRSDERARLANERGHFMTHHPTRMFDLLE
jgi:heme-degrading monooxygenase HmoA